MNRYKNVDDEDDEVEESNFAQMMKEEVRSTRIGMFIFLYSFSTCF